MSGLVFYPASHRYKLDGQWVPGVTTVLGVLNKPAIPKWAAKQVATYVADNPDGINELRNLGRNPMVNALKEIPWARRDEASARGTAFHDYAERIANGEEVDVPEALVPLVESCLDFMETYDIDPVLVEATIASREHRYAGKLDLIADSRVGRAIWDYKSGKAIYPQFALQLNAYAFAEFHGESSNEAPLPECEAAYGVHIREDGYDVYPLKFGRDIWREFLAVREVYEINKRVEGDWRTPASGYCGLALPQERPADAS